jgi:Mg2+ and Co2+ transporter CorA
MHAPIPITTPRTSLFEDLLRQTLTLPSPIPSLLPTHPTALALPILSLIAAEWLTVIAYITTGLTKIEWELEHPTYRDALSGLDGALDRLHPLRRLLPVYKTMILEVLSTLLAPNNLSPSSPLQDLYAQFNKLLSSLSALQTRTQNIISLATTIISIEENHRATKMNKNLVRVTYLAVVFVPMAFVSSFFSMSPNLQELEQTIWVYFAVALPLTGVCLVVADQGKGLGIARRWLLQNVGWGRRIGA